MKRSTLVLAALLLLVGPTACNSQPVSTLYHIAQTIKIGGDGGWDYLTIDSTARRLYVSHQNSVVVLDADNGNIVGRIDSLAGVHGIALASEFNKGFISNGRSSTVTVFDTRSLEKMGSIKAGTGPDAIIYDPFTKCVYAFNGHSNNATVIDAASDKVVATIPLGGNPEFAVSDENGHIYVNLEEQAKVVAINAVTKGVEHTWPLVKGEGPTGIAMDRSNRRLFVGCANQMMIVMNADNGSIVGSFPIGSRVDATAFDPVTKLAFSSNGEGTLSIIQEDTPDSYTPLGNVKTELGARTMTLDLKTHNIFTATAQFGATPQLTTEHPRPRPQIIPDSFIVLKLTR